MKLIRKPIIAAITAVIIDIIMLALAVVLNLLRGKFPAQYSFNETDVKVEIFHPYDYFGILTAAALAAVIVIAALIIAAALTGAKAKTASRIVGAIILVVLSSGAVLFSHYIVCGIPDTGHICYVFRSEECDLAIQETEYIDGTGTVEVFKLTELPHDHESLGTAEHEHYNVTFLAASEIQNFSTDNNRYTLEWDINGRLVIKFKDGMSYRSFNIRLD